MGLLQQEIKELRQLNNDFINGKLSVKVVNTQIAVYSQIEKRAKLMLSAMTIQAKFKGKISRELKNTNLIGNNEAIDTNTNHEVEMIKCPNTDKLITRAECLDTSGSSPQLCVDCEHNKITKDRLL